MKGFRTTEEDIKIKEKAIEQKKQFEVEFNRYYATQRYEEAFAVCLKYKNYTDCNSLITNKAKYVIPKLKNRIQIPSSIQISYDWLIDQLVLAGYNNMKFDGTSLKWRNSTIKLSFVDNITRITSKCRINLFFRIVIFIALSIMTIPFFAIICNYIYSFDYLHNSYDNYHMLFWGIAIAVIFFIIWVSIYNKFKQHRTLLRRIAQIIIDKTSEEQNL